MNLIVPPATYSKLTAYELCPKKYYHTYVAKDLPKEEVQHLIYGNEVHKSCELYIDQGKPLPEKYIFAKPYLDKLKALPGDKFAEYKVGLKKVDGQLVSCDFYDPEVWFRGIIDLFVIGMGKAWIIDYKTGSNKYPDTKQLALMASCIFIRWPKIQKIHAGLLFFKAPELIKVSYEFDRRFDIFVQLNEVIRRREESYATGVFNAKRNFTCSRWCDVYSCKHNGRS